MPIHLYQLPWLLLMVVLSLGARDHGAAMKPMRTPFGLELELVQENAQYGNETRSELYLQAVLINISDRPQVYLPDHFPLNARKTQTTPALFTRLGRALPVHDMGARMKWGPTTVSPHKDSFRTLQPGERGVLYRSLALESRNKPTYQLNWGHWRTSEIKPGVYFARVTWETSWTMWQGLTFGDDSNASGTVEGIWRGTLKSKKTRIVLPERKIVHAPTADAP